MAGETAKFTGAIVTGDKVLDRLLKGLPSKVQKKLSRKATRKAAKDIVLPAAKARVPVNHGDLEDSLRVKAVKRSRHRFGHLVTTGEWFGTGDQFYGAFVEFGTKERFHRASAGSVTRDRRGRFATDKARVDGKHVGRIDPSKNFAYLRPAVYDNRPQITEAYIQAMREFINEAASK